MWSFHLNHKLGSGLKSYHSLKYIKVLREKIRNILMISFAVGLRTQPWFPSNWARLPSIYIGRIYEPWIFSTSRVMQMSGIQHASWQRDVWICPRFCRGSQTEVLKYTTKLLRYNVIAFVMHASPLSFSVEIQLSTTEHIFIIWNRILIVFVSTEQCLSCMYLSVARVQNLKR